MIYHKGELVQDLESIAVKLETISDDTNLNPTARIAIYELGRKLERCSKVIRTACIANHDELFRDDIIIPVPKHLHFERKYNANF